MVRIRGNKAGTKGKVIKSPKLKRGRKGTVRCMRKKCGKVPKDPERDWMDTKEVKAQGQTIIVADGPACAVCNNAYVRGDWELDGSLVEVLGRVVVVLFQHKALVEAQGGSLDVYHEEVADNK